MTQFVDEKDADKGERLEHPSFGMARLNMTQSNQPLFGVDYPTGHMVALTISKGMLEENLHRHWFFERDGLIRIEMSEVQWARLVASVNSTAVPVTIRRYREGNFVSTEDPPVHMREQHKMKEDTEKMARRVAANLDHLVEITEAMSKPGAKVTKKQLEEAAMWAQQTRQAIQSDLPYLTKTQIEQVDDMVQSAKAEVDAHIQFSLNELGKQALGEQIKHGGVSISVGDQQKRLGKEDDDAEG